MVRRLKSAQEGIPFLDILLDETICEGEILAPEELGNQLETAGEAKI